VTHTVAFSIALNLLPLSIIRIDTTLSEKIHQADVNKYTFTDYHYRYITVNVNGLYRLGEVLMHCYVPFFIHLSVFFCREMGFYM